MILQFLTQDSFTMNQIDANEPDVADYHQLPDTTALAETVRSCLQESEDLPKDFRNLFDFDLFKFDTTYMSHAIGLYDVFRCLLLIF